MAALNWFRRQRDGVFLGKARVPDGCRVFAIGDIHGRSDCLDAMISMIEEDCRSDPPQSCRIVFLGDYCDRGPDTKGVIERLLRLAQRPEVVCLRGNHDQWVEDFMLDPSVGAAFIQWGGEQTLASYGVEAADRRDFSELSRELAAAVPPAHRLFLRRLRHSHVEGDYFFCHAGVRPGIPIDQQDPQDLMWIRGEFHSHGGDFGKVVVHGHTPVGDVDARANRINADTRAYETGVLSCVVLEEDRWRVLQTSCDAL